MLSAEMVRDPWRGFLALSSIVSSMVSGRTLRSLVHGLGLDISVEIEVRFRESIFLRPVGTCSDLATFRCWHVQSPFRHG